MARVAIPLVVQNPTTGLPVSGATVNVQTRAGAAATHWSAETGGTSATTALTTGANGRLTAERWVERGSYNLVVTGTVSFTEFWEAAPATGADSAWMPASGLDLANVTTGEMSPLRLTGGSGGPLRLLSVINLQPWSATSSSGTFDIRTPVSVAHNNRNAIAFLMQNAFNTGSAVTVSWGIKLDGVNNTVYTATSVATNHPVGVARFYDVGTLASGTHTWTATFTMPGTGGGAMSTIATGTLVIFER